MWHDGLIYKLIKLKFQPTSLKLYIIIWTIGLLTLKLIVPHQAYATLQRERHKDPSCRPHFTISTLATSPPLHQSPSASLPTMPPYSAIASPPIKQFELFKHTSPNLKSGLPSGEFQLILKKQTQFYLGKKNPNYAYST
ncbi:hypothetical protein TNCV_4442801 [Trichonephila clavipes]|nr:hypothetical protein TNCV_4442801 [Trichonephila clavipes]